MTALPPYALVQLARQAGFSEQEAPLMAAIAMAESGGRPDAHNPNRNTGDDSYGLWQVNMIDRLGDERRAQFGLQSNDQLFDPQRNAQVAKAIRDSQGLGAWSVYRSGAYRQFLPLTQQAAATAGAADPATGALGGPAPLPSLDDLLTPASGAATPAAATRAAAAAGELDPLAAALIASDAANAIRVSPRRMRMAGSNPLVAALVAKPLDLSLLAPPAPPAPAQAPPAVAAAPSASASAGTISLVELGKALQRKGLQVAEHSAFGGNSGGHAKNSYHNSDQALDLTVQRGSPLLAGRPDSDWPQVTAEVGRRLQQALPGVTELLHPGNDARHKDHIHLAAKDGRVALTPALQQFLAGG